MKSIDVESLLQDIIQRSETLAQQLIHDFTRQGVRDIKEFLTKSKDDLVRWTEALVQKQISEDEFHDLVEGQIDVALLHGLKEGGLAQVEIDRFTSGVVDIITMVAFDAAKSVL